MKKILVFCMICLFSTTLFAGKGILRVSANMNDVDIYNGNEQIAMIGEGNTDLELEKGKYTIILRKTIDENSEYFALKKIFVGANSVTRVKFKLKKALTQKGKEIQVRQKQQRDIKRAKDKKDWQKLKNKVINHNGVSYKMVKSPYTGEIWLDRNLGASRVCASYKDNKCYGDYFQWGREADGHEKKNSSTTSSLSKIDTPNHSKFMKANNSPYDWRKGQNKNLWQKTNGKDNPCPTGFKVPSINELLEETVNQGVKNRKDAFRSFLKLPSAGYRHLYDALMYRQGSRGSIWSSSVDGKDSYYLGFYSGNASKSYNNRADGFSLRCLKD